MRICKPPKRKLFLFNNMSIARGVQNTRNYAYGHSIISFRYDGIVCQLCRYGDSRSKLQVEYTEQGSPILDIDISDATKHYPSVKLR